MGGGRHQGFQDSGLSVHTMVIFILYFSVPVIAAAITAYMTLKTSTLLPNSTPPPGLAPPPELTPSPTLPEQSPGIPPEIFFFFAG